MAAQYDPYTQQAAAPVARAYAPARPRPTFLPQIEEPRPAAPGLRLDGLAIAALIFVAFLVVQSLLDGGGFRDGQAIDEPNEAAAESLAVPQAQAAPAEKAEPAEAPSPLTPAADPGAIAYPYDEYWVTQGPHGFSYGHMAIDIAAGKGAPVKSPIHGKVTGNYIDQYGNTTLIIENEVYVITLLHGNFSAQVGQQVALGDVVGSEGNNGYTTDMQGRSCRNRDCGYHSHLNVFSKASQSNVNPLQVLK